jgi:tetratricopeptide (TPR) repeat protein
MPMQERLQLAGAIVEHRGKRLADLPDLTPLLKFTQGNPLTILVAIGEALRAGVNSKDKLDAFVAELRSGEITFEDEATEGRTKSLGASLSYGFASAFNEDERKQLALLHLFQGFVDVDALRMMGSAEADWAVDELRGLTRDQGIGLLDRAAEIGLLLSHGGGYYGVHPALPWYFRDLFERYYTGDKTDQARRAFVEAMGALGDYYTRQYDAGNNQVLGALMAEEDNLLAAWRLARQHGWWRGVISAMQGLQTLFTETGRASARRRLVDAVTPDFVDPRTDLPLPGREDDWSFVTQYRVRLAQEERDLAKAERLRRLCVDWDRERAGAALAEQPERRSDAQRNAIRTLAADIFELGEIQRFSDDPACVESYREAFGLLEVIGDKAAQSTCAFNLGIAYTNLTGVRDFDVAERCLRQSLDLAAPENANSRGKTLNQLSKLSLVRFDAANAEGRQPDELLHFLNDAARYAEQALQLLPPTAIDDRGNAYSHIGVAHQRVGDFGRALRHFQHCILYCEQADDILKAGQIRQNVAVTLLQAKRFGDAHAHAEAALANFREFGDRAAHQIQNAEQLLAHINEVVAQKEQS